MPRPFSLLLAALTLFFVLPGSTSAQPRYTEPAFWVAPSLATPPLETGVSRRVLPGRSVADSLARRAPADRWLSFDKAQHMTFSFLFTLGGQYTLVNKLDLREARALPLSAGFSAGVGLAKEVYDRNATPSRHFSRKDLVADAAGILLAVGLIAL